MLSDVLIHFKDQVKYQTVEFKGQRLKVLGIGQKAIKYSINGQDAEFAYHDSPQGFHITQVILDKIVSDKIDIKPYCETHSLTAYDSCDCCICDNFHYCY